MKNEVKDIHVQKMVTRTEWDEEKQTLSTTIQIKTNIPVETIAALISLQKLGAPMYITVGSDQAKLPLTEPTLSLSIPG